MVKFSVYLIGILFVMKRFMSVIATVLWVLSLFVLHLVFFFFFFFFLCLFIFILFFFFFFFWFLGNVVLYQAGMQWWNNVVSTLIYVKTLNQRWIDIFQHCIGHTTLKQVWFHVESSLNRWGFGWFVFSCFLFIYLFFFFFFVVVVFQRLCPLVNFVYVFAHCLS